MARSAKDVQAFFERVATDWDTMRLAYYDERVIEKMAEVGSIDEGSEIADVGTGTGFVAAGLAPRVKRVIGIDNASAMLRVARENLDSLGVSNAELLVGDLAELPLADNSVDATFANMVLHHAVDPVVMLEEMGRIVRPGGMIVIADEVEHPYEWMREEHADVWLGFSPEQVEGFFREARLADYRYNSLGMQ
ncbi:MAG: class I SAM-dependent methyltransferase [Actinomycetota bacterium]|nr:class I SAM-dependent methyltransferase [Actinomycetota bacterium]